MAPNDKLPKKICNECVQKIDLFYQFCNTTTNAEKQLLEWIGEVDLNDKETYVSTVINQVCKLIVNATKIVSFMFLFFFLVAFC